MIRRSSKDHILKILKQKKSKWKILDIGCNRDAIPYAQTVADTIDFTKFYKKKKFVLIKSKQLPFKNNSFDFVYASHVIEHIDDVSFFIQELQRISKQGYIELPSLLEDNIILSPNSSKDHKWFFQFDDINKMLLIEKKKQLIEPFITNGLLFSGLRKNFRSSLVLELFWKNNIHYKFKKFSNQAQKIYFFTIVKKYFSYKFRNNKLLIVFLTIIVFFMLYVLFS